jgi:hypothetical protein
MSLPARFDDEAAMRVLERKCADPNSIVSKRTVRQLAAGSLVEKEVFMHNSTIWGWQPGSLCAGGGGVA